MKYLIAIIALFVSIPAFADTGTWNWTAPTVRNDPPTNTPFDMATEGLGFYVWIDGAQVMNGANPLLVPPNTPTYIEALTINVQKCAEFAAVDLDGRVGPRSAPVCGLGLAPPAGVGSVTITITPQ